MKIIVVQPTIIGGVDYQPSPSVQDVPDDIGQHMVDIGNGLKIETKVVTPSVKKSKASTSVSQQGQASPGQTVKKRRGRPPKQSSSMTATD